MLAASTARSATPNYWMCSNMIGGQWAFGNAPNACDVTFQRQPAAVRSEFKPVLFLDASAGEPERARYMGEMYPAMRDFASYYIKRRNPSVSAQEIQGFQTGLFALAYQESFWSHYRDGSDGKVRYMRGDSGHGHGIMQVDDNAHFADINSGKGVDLSENVLFGLDEFYSNWLLAAKQSCVGNPADYVKRARAAWAAYNGGPGSICRFANPNSPWKQHDIDFNSKITGQAWNHYVANKTAASKLNVKCLAEGARPCALGAPRAARLTDGLYSASGGRSCLLKVGALECVSTFADVACLEAREGQALPVIGALAADDEAALPAKSLDRVALCSSSVSGLIAIGSDIQLKKAEDLVSAPGGAALAQAAPGATYRVLDFAVTNGSTAQDRYYQISLGGKTGFVYGGSKSDAAAYAAIASPAAPAPAPSTQGLAKASDFVDVVAPAGINLRAVAGADPILALVPKGARVQVLAVSITGSNSYVYYKTAYAGKTGFIYAGALKPSSSLSAWTAVSSTAVAAAAPAPRFATLAPGASYRFLRTCGALTCAYSASYVLADPMDTTCQNANCSAKGERLSILEERSGWTRVQSTSSGAAGWLPSADVKEFVP